ncbi:hypothetical protein HYR99_34905 [Candidatus Poribacteria bacterium]|nr:hypothetical protein [Candidatus Poribacteria bacterium]
MLTRRPFLIWIGLVMSLGVSSRVAVAGQKLQRTLMRERLFVPSVYVRHWNIEEMGESN